MQPEQLMNQLTTVRRLFIDYVVLSKSYELDLQKRLLITMDKKVFFSALTQHSILVTLERDGQKIVKVIEKLLFCPAKA